MPLNTQILRNGENFNPGGWDFFALSCIFTAAFQEADPDGEYAEGRTWDSIEEPQWVDFSAAPIYAMGGCPLLEVGEQVLEADHKYESDRVIELKAGDKLRAWRSSSSSN